MLFTNGKINDFLCKDSRFFSGKHKSGVSDLLCKIWKTDLFVSKMFPNEGTKLVLGYS